METLIIIGIVIVTIAYYILWGAILTQTFIDSLSLAILYEKTQPLKVLLKYPGWIRKSLLSIIVMIIGIIHILILCSFYIPVLNWIIYKLITKNKKLRNHEKKRR